MPCRNSPGSHVVSENAELPGRPEGSLFHHLASAPLRVFSARLLPRLLTVTWLSFAPSGAWRRLLINTHSLRCGLHSSAPSGAWRQDFCA